MSVEVDDSAARVRNNRATRNAPFMSEEFFIVRGVRAAVFVGVADRPALPALSLVQIDNIVAAKVAEGVDKRRPALLGRPPATSAATMLSIGTRLSTGSAGRSATP